LPVDDRALLRDLRAALERTEGSGAAERQRAIQDVLDAHGATADDVARLLRRARTQHRSQLQGLSSRLEDLIALREEEQATAEAVERFLRDLRS
jgi:hypothetical protein